jgi:hypothetical protein
MAYRTPAHSDRNDTPFTVKALLAVGLPMVAAMAVVGTFLGKEIIMFAGLLGMSVVGFLFVRPIVGIAIMSTAYLLAAYPTVFQQLGLLSVNNLLGLCLAILLLVRILETRDLKETSFQARAARIRRSGIGSALSGGPRRHHGSVFQPDA